MSKALYTGSAVLLERSKKVLAGGVSSEFRKYNHPHAIFYTHGRGAHIYDADGNDYLDFTLSQGPLILGHSHEYVLNAVNEYSNTGQLFAGQHIREIELAEKIQRIIPGAELMRFCLDGSEAVQVALRVARASTGKKKFLRFEGHYHGWLDNVSWGISSPSPESLGSREHPSVYPWSEGLPENCAEQFIVIPWNDPELLRKTVTENIADIAAIITEPVMCNNGCVMPEPGFLELMRSLCDEHNIALIFDEVITGFRIHLSGAQAYFGIVPDISVFAKAMASGYPISVVAGKKEWMKLIEEGRVIHAGTMNSGNPSIAAAYATIEVLEKEAPYERMFAHGKKLMKELVDAAHRHGHKVLLQGPGPMFNISFTHADKIVDYRGTLKTDKKKLGAFISAMHDEKIRIIGRGLWYISAAHTEEDIDYALSVAEKVFKTLEK